MKSSFLQFADSPTSYSRKGSMLISEKDYEKYLTISKGLAKKSIRTYLIRFRILNRWLEQNDAVLSKSTVENFLYLKKTDENLSNAALNTYIQALKHIEECFKYHELPADFIDGLKGLPKTRANIIPLSKDEIKRLLETRLTYKNRNGVDCSNLDLNYLTITKFFAITACRFEEAASLKVGNLDIDNGRATLLETKNKENRFIFFNGPIKDELRKLIAGKKSEDLVFTNSKGKHIFAGDFNDNLKLRAKNAGITKKVHVHLLRHSYATQFYTYTHDIAMTATILGHKDIQTTYDTYVHLDTETIQRATDRHPLLSQYIPVKEVLNNIKSTLEGLKISDDKRLEAVIIMNKEKDELLFTIKIINSNL
jgi:integrase